MSVQFRPIKSFKNYIDKAASDHNFHIKTMIVSSAAIELYQNGMDARKALKNKKLPKDERDYIASYKITNGLLAFATEATVGCVLANDKVQNRLADICFKRLKNTPKIFDKCAKGLKFLFSLLVASVFLRRLIVPFVSTPLASRVKDRVIEKNQKKEKVNCFAWK